MPTTSPAQHRLMEAAAHTPGGYGGVPERVGKEFVAADSEPQNELDVAKAIRDGTMPSPQRYENVDLFDMRVTGTGAAYRLAHDEYVWRDPSLYLNDEFLQRCNGLPVIFEHPERATLDADEFSNRVVGTILLPYIKGAEVWGIAKIYDDGVAKLMANHQLSTSPCVVLSKSDKSETVSLDDGSTLLIEGKPSLLDHLAICEQGVWDKAGAPRGVRSEGLQSMTDEEREAEDKAKKDAAEAAEKEKADAAAKKDGENKPDPVLEKLDAVMKRMDAWDEERKADAAKRDAEKDPEDAKRLAADKAKKDAEGEKEKAEKAKADAEEEVKKKIADLDARMPKDRADEEMAEMADAQERCDSVAQAFGERAPPPLINETARAYRLRLANKYKANSSDWKSVDLGKLPAEALGVAEKAIYADSVAAAALPGVVPAGTLRERVRTTDGGHRIREFSGSIRDAFSPFRIEPRRLVGIKTQGH